MDAPFSPRFCLVSLLDMLKFYGDKFFKLSFQLTYAEETIQRPETGLEPWLINFFIAQIEPNLREMGLDIALLYFQDLQAELLASPPSRESIAAKLLQLRDVIEKELKLTMLLSLSKTEAHLFNEPRKGWNEVIERFPDTITDIEECGRCFALSRYAASVFHSVQVVEVGLIHLGGFLQVKDPLSGWTAVTQELRRIVSVKYPDRTQFEKDNKEFIEQMQGCIEALKNAWRNKISHAHRRLTLMTSDFVPDVAEEIRMATRAFMRRLATEMPELVEKD